MSYIAAAVLHPGRFIKPLCACRFIGELFKLKMLTEGIMHDCIRRLLRARDEESLECLCRLLTTIGCDLDKDRSRVSTC